MLLPSAAHAPSVASDSPVGLAPVSVWARGFLEPCGLAVDARDVLYVSDRLAGSVTRIAPDQSMTIVARGLERPAGLAFDLDGRLLVAEERAGRVTRLETGGGRTTIVSGIKLPRWLHVAEDGTVFITARRMARGIDPEVDDESTEPEAILALTPTGALAVFADGFRGLRGIVGGDGFLYAATDGRRGAPRAEGVLFQIPVLPGARAGVATELTFSGGNFIRPTALARDRLGALFLTTHELGTDAQRTRAAVAKLHPAGRVSPFAAGFDHPQGLGFDAAGNLYVADGPSGRIFRFLAPPRPELDPLGTITNEPSIRVRGSSLPSSRVDGRVDGGGSVFTTQSNEAGEFVLTIALSRNAANTVEVFATAERGDGLTGAAADAIIRHDDVPPETTITGGPSSPTDASTATFTFTGADDVSAAADLRFAWRLDGRPFGEFAQAGSVVLSDLADGTHTFEVVARDRAGNIDPTPATTTFTVSTSRIVVEEPAPGVSVPAGLQLVRGTVAVPGPELGVTINGVTAAVDGNTFAALVPLAESTMELLIEATNAEGDSVRQEVPVAVTAAAESPVVLITSSPSGVAPLTVRFALLGAPASATLEADFDGNGAVDWTGVQLDGHVFTYAQPGLYAPVVTVTDVQGNRSTALAIVHVFDRASLDTLLLSKWTSLRDALRRGDIAQAMTQVSERSRSRYQQAFTALAADLPDIDTILTDITFVRTRGLEAIFEMSRTDAGVVKSFEVRFRVDTDGLWRVRSF